jgi:hypothetical protein
VRPLNLEALYDAGARPWRYVFNDERGPDPPRARRLAGVIRAALL